MKRQKLYPFQAENRAVFCSGMKVGFPIGLGYFAVAFSLGIVARQAGLNAAEGFLISLLCNASAGEKMGLLVIGADSGYIEMILATVVANARYLLMSCSLSQRMRPELPMGHRLLIGFDITDEIFGVTVARPGYINPWYTYGAMVTSIPLWASGTSLGILAGEILPSLIVGALGVALYGMFLAVIIPPARKSRVIAGLIVICFVVSYAASRLPYVSQLSEGSRTIVLTLVIAGAAALLFPRREEESHE